MLIPGVGAAARAPALQTDFTHVSREAFNLSPQPCGRRSQGLVLSAHPAGVGRITATRVVLGAAFWARGDCALLTPVMVLGAAGALRASSG